MDRTPIHYAQSADPIHPAGIVGLLYILPFRGAGPVSPCAVGVTRGGAHPRTCLGMPLLNTQIEVY
ncbi:unnamed protein product [Staurois parvus]|uniref:Uncharacterized protein n=1 Tax=Staurois parvus TaxID=386267 RepID=A0ABN9ATZ2_9NEOB|nr:unnamed protein product [Staurois parvus]